jgi:cobaltochelatase CobS
MFNVSIDSPLSRLNLPVYDARDCALDTSYVMPACVPAILLMAIEHRTGIFLTGPAGTGKTTLAQQIAARLGRPYVRISCTANTDAATLVGMTVPDKDGGVIFQPGILTRAVTRPGVVLLIDEPSTARDGILYVLQSLLDDARRITVDETGDVFPLAQDAIVILADNTNGSGDSTGTYAGTRTLSRALLDRVEMFHVDYLPPDKEQTVLISHTGATHNLAAMVIEFARVTRAKVAEGEIPTAIGMRRLVSLTRQLMAGIPLPDAAATAFLNSAAPDVREVYQQLMTTHLPADAIARSLKA